MRVETRLWRCCRPRAWTGLGAALLLLASGGAALAATPAQGQTERNYDARVEFNKGFKAAPVSAQLQGEAELRKDMPDLGVSYSNETGVARSVLNYMGYLTPPAKAGMKPADIGLQFVRAHFDLFGLTEDDLADMETTDTVYSAVSGATYVYLRQRHSGLSLYNGQLHFGIGKEGRILIVNNAFLPGLASAVNTTSPALSASDAVLSAARSIGIDGATPLLRSAAKGAQQVTVFDAPDISRDPVQAKLMLLPIRQGDARLVWNFQIYTRDSQHWYDMNVDAVDGTVWTRIDWVASDTYKAYDRPAESPIHVLAPLPQPPADGRSTVVNPADAQASPFGWHDTNGSTGPEFTITQGNNVNAYTDTDNNNAPDPGSQPDGGASLVFNFPIDLTMAPSAYRPATVANLFFWNNLIHDIHQHYGFDAVGGNFQVNNYGGGGLGGDDVQAEAQDGGGTNNANFATPVDGQRPRMQMYLWNGGTPNRDGDLDSGIVAHEYGHGISNRLVGGPSNVSCLGNAQQPGEGLSDWWALFITGETGDTGPDPRGIGTYALFQPTSGPGIRTQRYSTNPAVNTWTYASVTGSVIPHGVGEKWAEGYWKVYWKLVDNWGFDLNLYNATGNAGNLRANLYIIEGLKATICSPAFTDVRNGIITAVTNLHSGEDKCRVWAAFAAYGLGIDATSGGPGSTNTTNGFLLPVECRPAGPSNLTATATAPNRISLSWTTAPGAVTYNVYRATGACPQTTYNQIAQNVATTTYDDNTVSGGITYSYVVTAVDANSVESGFSNCDDAVATGTCTTPPTFAGLTSVTNAGTPACALNLSWSAGTANCPATTLKYNVYRSTTPGFTPNAASLRQSCVNALTFSDTTVNSGTPYYYVVRAEDSITGGPGLCNGGNEDANTVQKSGAPYGPTSATVTDTVENGGGYWNTAGGTGANVWAIVTTDAHSPTHSWFVADPAAVSDQPLATIAAGNIPASFTMAWWDRYNTETSTTPGTGYDGHVLEYSLDGNTWVDILAGTGPIPANANRITQNPYNATISPNFQSPLAGRRAWSGDNLAFQEMRVDLSDFSGQSAFFRFRFASDNSVSDVGVWIDDITFRAPGACNVAASVAPFGLSVDAGGNRVLQPNETAVAVAPTWRNTGAGSVALTGALTNFTGPGGPTYTIDDGSADYGTIASSTNQACTDCYAVTVTSTARPVQHWDAMVTETVTPTATAKTWLLHVGDSFTDVLASNGFFRFVEIIFHKGVTGGCGGTNYCPSDATTRAQMAVFVLVSKEGVGYNPPACVPPNIFTDVPETSGFCKFIEELSNRGVVAGCAPNLYCPNDPVTRAQMAIFTLRTLDPALNPPACGTPVFADVPASNAFCKWIEELARRGVVTGCGGGNYCPNDSVTRDQMGVFLSVTFGLTLYGL